MTVDYPSIMPALITSGLLGELESLRAKVKTQDAEIARLNEKLRDVAELCKRYKATLQHSRPLGMGVD